MGWAVAYVVKTYHERLERGWPLTNDRHVMSPAYIYNQIKVPGGGAYFVDAFSLLVDQGVSSWAQMPYDPRDDQTQPSSRARAEAANYKIADWGTVQRTTHAVFVQEIKRHLVGGDPVLIGIPVYPDFDYLSESNPVYDDDSGSYRGAHAIVIVGYDDQRSAFKIANSWGTDWGIGGYGWIDYDASESLIWMAYVTEDVVASPDDERPGTASDPSPGSAATSVAVDTVLRWTKNARTTSFDVYLGVDPRLSAVDFQGNVARAEFAPHLAPGSRYYWRIDARGAGGITQGPVWTLTTAGMLEEPGKPVNPSPADGATGVVHDSMLRWDSGGRTTSYDVYFGSDPVLGASEFQQTQATRTYYPMGLKTGTRYYWRIDAKNGQATTTGDVWTFTTVDDVQNPLPRLPSIGDKTYTIGTSLAERLPSATGGNGTLIYSLSPSVPGLAFDPSSQLLYGTPSEPGTYQMQYRVQDADGDADDRSFTIIVVEEPGEAMNPSPADDATGVIQDTELRWDSGGRTTSYDVYFGSDPVLGASEFQQTQATRTYYPMGLKTGTRYYWRIDAKNGQATTTGDVWTFTTVDDVQNPLPRLPSIGDKTYTIGTSLAERLPSATGGNGTLIYSLSPSVPGLAFDPSSQLLYGTPRESGDYHMRYRVQDEDGDTDSQSFTIAVVAAPEPEPLPQDFDVLLSIKDALIGDGDPTLNWSADIPLASWTGVSVSDDRVVELDLSASPDGTDRRPNRDLSGTIPAALGNLSQLRSLDLRFNTLSGSIPTELSNLSRLESLLLSGNDLSGSIPATLGNLSQLQYLYLSHNDLSGTIPGELGNLSQLEWLDIYGNDLSGGIPAALGSMSQLRALDLGGNGLSATIPAALGNLSQLQYLDLSHNDLSGTIPGELGNLSQLQSLHLYSNRLSGCIPATLSRFQGDGGSGINSQQGGRNLPLCDR